MRGLLMLAMLLVAGDACGQTPQRTAPLTLRERADSLTRLDPKHELQAALQRGDKRCIAIQGYLAAPAGVSLDSLKSIWPVLCAHGMRIIEGTSDGITPDVAHLNAVAAEYGTRYNQLLLPILRGAQFTDSATPPAFGRAGAITRPAP